MMDICEPECPYDTSTVDMEEGVNDRNYDKNKNTEGKEAECPDDTSTVDMEEGVNDRKYDNNKNVMRKKRQNY